LSLAIGARLAAGRLGREKLYLAPGERWLAGATAFSSRGAKGGGERAMLTFEPVLHGCLAQRADARNRPCPLEWQVALLANLRRSVTRRGHRAGIETCPADSA